ncbi:HET-domain-containing protein [Rhizodiscina lignyota]|uniref:HET-domain-containing protein n=1 Tax=Rhizodiscina lignyota TaxID=1504668 RepID=A0A9P4IHA6_9PEZI|nr:HET-domain-containing protein [Rhizodiscina lignyota]
MQDFRKLPLSTFHDADFNIAGIESTCCNVCPICTVFQNLDERWDIQLGKGTPLCSVSKLNDIRACGFAAQLASKLSESDISDSSASIKLQLDWGARIFQQFRGSITAQFLVEHHDKRTTQLTYFNAFALPGSKLSQYVESSPANPFPASSNTVRTARSWIAKCSEKHERCPKLSAAPLPTRVLDLDSNNLNNLTNIKLLETMGRSGSYAALSYCWGSSQFMTTSMNYSANCRQIKLEALAKSIRDAILFTKQLGIRYLWVDALCIIQDDSNDKYTEIGNMSGIYKNAAVTLSAARSRTCQDGFLHDNDLVISWMKRAFKLSFRCPDGYLDDIFLAEMRRESSPKEPIDFRAWTFQESLLSPRSIIFSSSQTLWRCISGTSADGHCAPWERLSAVYGTIGPIRNSTISETDATDDEPRDDDTLHQTRQMAHLRWADIVHEVTSRHLTVGQDKLPSISAIATELAFYAKDMYLAGIWKSNLIPSLLWCQGSRWSLYKASVPLGRPAQYRAPSWSWASVDGPVDFHNSTMQHDTRAEVQSVEIVPVSNKAPLCAIKSGFLELYAPVRRVDCGELAEMHRQKGDDECSSTAIYLDAGAALPACFRSAGSGDGGLWSGSRRTSCHEYWLLELSALHTPGFNHEIKGLVLESAAGGVYKRAGYFYIEDYFACVQESANWDDALSFRRIRII